MENIEEVEERESWFKKVLVLLLLILVFGLLAVYWFNPFAYGSFGTSGNSNFNLNNSTIGMQFYENMRYPDSKISYKVIGCPLQKKNDMQMAFEIIENKTILEFYEVQSDQEISVTCEDNVKLNEGLFIAGEGGPENIFQSGNFNIILNGMILLIRDSQCPEPNVAIHELLHALGFDHSKNPDNLMYNISNCNQEIGEDTISFINEIYSIESLPDLVLENVSARTHKIYLDFNASIKNNGFVSSGKSSFDIYVDGKFLKSFDVDKLKVGSGITLSVVNIPVLDLNVKKVNFYVNYSGSELDKKNNEIELNIGD